MVGQRCSMGRFASLFKKTREWLSTCLQMALVNEGTTPVSLSGTLQIPTLNRLAPISASQYRRYSLVSDSIP